MAFGLGLCLLLTGCASYPPGDGIVGGGYRPENVYVKSPVLPPALKRVAVLPLVSDDPSYELAAGQAALEPLLQAELAKSARFEIVRADAQCLGLQTGQECWRAEEVLPPGLLGEMSRATSCDGVIFCQLTVFRAYPALAVGWRMRLVDVQTGITLWAADEVFDAGQPAVLAAARRYQLAQLQGASGQTDEWTMRNSPRQFGQYAIAQVLASLPSR